MNIHIVNKQVKESNSNGRYYLEITLSECTDYLWQQSFKEAIGTEKITCSRSTGAPVVSNLYFEYDKIITPSFPEYAQNDLPEFIKELEHFIPIANSIYNFKQACIRQKQEQAEKEKQERLKKLEEMNKKINP